MFVCVCGGGEVGGDGGLHYFFFHFSRCSEKSVEISGLCILFINSEQSPYGLKKHTAFQNESECVCVHVCVCVCCVFLRALACVQTHLYNFSEQEGNTHTHTHTHTKQYPVDTNLVGELGQVYSIHSHIAIL